jgi:hypothetical protein
MLAPDPAPGNYKSIGLVSEVGPAMLPGFNHNLRHRDRVFHVQTEDGGLSAPQLLTQVFIEGHLIGIEKSSYAELLAPGTDPAVRTTRIRGRMQEQHKRQMKLLVAGAYDAKVAVYLEAIARRDAPAEATSDAGFLAALDAQVEHNERTDLGLLPPLPVQESAVELPSLEPAALEPGGVEPGRTAPGALEGAPSAAPRIGAAPRRVPARPPSGSGPAPSGRPHLAAVPRPRPFDATATIVDPLPLGAPRTAPIASRQAAALEARRESEARLEAMRRARAPESSPMRRPAPVRRAPSNPSDATLLDLAPVRAEPRANPTKPASSTERSLDEVLLGYLDTEDR